MDNRIRKYIESIAGLSLDSFPDEGVSIYVSDARTDKPKNRLLVQRVKEKNGVLITGIPRIVEVLKSNLGSMTSWEIFSPFGLQMIKRILPSNDAMDVDGNYGFDYFLTEHANFHPVNSEHEVTVLKKKDIPPGDYQLRMGERRSSETDDFTWAFACYHNDSGVRPVRLTEYGSQCASAAVVFWKGEELAGLGLATEEALQGQGYALAVVSAATQWILDQNAVAWYGAYSDNVPSLRIARRLGFSLLHSSFSV
jgi:RimJ/RimL family protein N-acetyltransferase